MDSSQLTRLKNEAANVYLSRAKTVDSSLLTFKKQQQATYAGTSRFKTSAYYKGNPTVNPILYDISSCPIDHSFKDGYTSVLQLSQQESLAMAKGGAAICCDADYSIISPGIYLLNPSTCSTILTSYNNNTPKPSLPTVVPQLNNVPRYVAPTNLPSMAFGGNSFIKSSTDTYYSGSSDFTLEFFVRPSGLEPSVQTTQTLFYIGAPIGTGNNGGLYKFFGNLVSDPKPGKYHLTVQVSTCGTLTYGELYPNKWYHVAVMRYGNVVYLFLNGTQCGIINIPSAGIPASSSPFITTYLSDPPSSTFESVVILGGAYDSAPGVFNNGFHGWISNFRFTKGSSIYLQYFDFIETMPLVFRVPWQPLDVYRTANRFVALALLSLSSATLLVNTSSPLPPLRSPVSVQDGNAIDPNTYSAVTWAIV